MEAPNPAWDLHGKTWEQWIKDCLETFDFYEWCYYELLKDAPPPQWRFELAQFICGECHQRVLRIRIKHHPHKPDYACPTCGWGTNYEYFVEGLRQHSFIEPDEWVGPRKNLRTTYRVPYKQAQKIKDALRGAGAPPSTVARDRSPSSRP